jgi:hypothetical protein
MQSASNITNSNQYEDVTNKVTINEDNISTLQGELVVDGSNLSVGGAWLAKNTTPNNTAIGYQTLINSTADNNTAVGCQALTTSTTGYLNTAIGTYSMYYLTEGINNAAIGFCFR